MPRRQTNKDVVGDVPLDERWVIAARVLSVVVLTACANDAILDDFDVPFDPRDPAIWAALDANLAEEVPAMAGPCGWMAKRIQKVEIAELRAMSTRIHAEAFREWPGVRGRLPTTEEDYAALADALTARIPVVAHPVALLSRAQAVLQHELRASGVPITDLTPDDDDSVLIQDALTELLGAEWALSSAGRARDAQRVGLARVVLTIAVLEWMRSGDTPTLSGGAAAAGVELLASGWPAA